MLTLCSGRSGLMQLLSSCGILLSFIYHQIPTTWKCQRLFNMQQGVVVGCTCKGEPFVWKQFTADDMQAGFRTQHIIFCMWHLRRRRVDSPYFFVFFEVASPKAYLSEASWLEARSVQLSKTCKFAAHKYSCCYQSVILLRLCKDLHFEKALIAGNTPW